MFIFNQFLDMWKARKYISCSKVGIDLLKLMRVKERSGKSIAFTKNLDLNNLESKLLKQRLGLFFVLAPFLVSKKEKCWITFDFTLTRACKPMTSSDSTLIRLEKVSDDPDSKNFWLDNYVSGTSLLCTLQHQLLWFCDPKVEHKWTWSRFQVIRFSFHWIACSLIRRKVFWI